MPRLCIASQRQSLRVVAARLAVRACLATIGKCPQLSRPPGCGPTRRSSGRSKACCARFSPPLISNVGGTKLRQIMSSTGEKESNVRKRILAIVFQAIILCLCADAWADEMPLLGTWRLKSFVREVTGTAERYNQLGDHPDGYINYCKRSGNPSIA